MAERVDCVRKLFKPKEFKSRAKKPVHIKRTFDAPTSIFLRRTSSALMTKYSRKFVSNMQLNAAAVGKKNN